ncbi:hypothetical protein [Salinisphaera sp.]|uniref:hypothetical protein n=1 Tax=Salinisphaera sp. TaxID=1914330 RepID=UPI002D7671B1|nr:hypothetical protein [Salinisphaera sp.]HET7313492.1 hypothetical protein [Salinisphaera sp.]
MNSCSTTARGLAAATIVLMLAACMDHPPPPRHPGPYDDPVDAFDATDAPYNPSARGPNQPLSQDLAHLRDARAAYEHSQAAQAARLQNQQEKCRNQPNAKLVRIHDGTDDPDAVFCQTRPGGDDDGS